MPKFTPDQLLGIETPTRDIVVSAGAGSGKTTVLAERIMRKIERGASLSDFLVVTFTNEAACDLKCKLSERLEQLAASNPENRAYRRLAYLLPGADIGTIDSFCLKRVRENAAVLGLTEGCSVGDEALCTALVDSAADEVLTRLCEEDEDAADLLLDNFATHKSDDQLLKAARSLYGKLRAYPFYMSWFADLVKRRDRELQTLAENGFFACEAGKQIREVCEKTLSRVESDVETLFFLCENEKQEAFCAKLKSAAEGIKAALDSDYTDFCRAVSYKIPSRPKWCGKDFVKVHEEIKLLINSFKEYIRTEEDLNAEYTREVEVLKALYKFTSLLDEAYSAAKRERGLLDFADVEQLMLRLLLTQTPDGCVKTGLCRRLSAQYSEIFIDEYQDVSPLQDAVFKAIGCGKRFMVGDVKQSIYGFRNAYPDIFTAYRDSFAPASENAPTAAVFLKENFRCGKPIINFCNVLFDKVFTKESAGTDYKSERLIYGGTESSTLPVRLLLLENADLQTEAEYVAEETARLIREGTKPFDIALLTRRRDSLNIFAEALKKRGVASFAPKIKRPLLKEPEVLLALALLRVIDNPTDDIALAALLRSPVFRFTADELCRIRRSSGTLYSDLLSVLSGDCRFTNGTYRLRRTGQRAKRPAQKPALIKRPRPLLAEKCARFSEKLKLYRAKALLLSVRELLWFLYEDTHLLSFAPEGREAQYKNNLYALLALAESSGSGVYKGVGAFTDYVSRLEESNGSPDAPAAPDEDAVRLMTIHSAKGLEFKTVFVCGCGGSIPYRNETGKAFSVNYHTGIGTKLASQKEAKKQNSLLRYVALKAEVKHLVAEEYRLLYVAFTRAKELLYVSAALKESAPAYFCRVAARPKLYADLFLPAIAEKSDDSFRLSIVNAEENPPAATPASGRKDETPPEDLRLPDLKELPEPPAAVTAKYSVSKLRRLENGLLGADSSELVSAKVPAFASKEDETGAAQGAARGTANHRFLQFASFAKAEKDIDAEVDRLVAEGFLEAEEAKLLNRPALSRFFASELYREIKAAKRVYREKRFTTRLPAALFTENGEGETVLVQGVIDCFFECPDGTYTLIDYKTDASAGERELRERYGTQLYLYALYIEKVTGKEVGRAFIYSLSQNKAVLCGLPDSRKDI